MIITDYAIRFRTSVYVLILFIIIAGAVAYSTLPLEAQPEVKIPVILVQTLYPGVAPEDMEKLVTNVLERQLKDLKNVKKLSSTSAESMSLITVEFETGVDLDNAYQKMRDKVAQARRDLPADAEEPTLIEINLSEFPMMLINVSAKYELTKLKQVAEDLEEKIEMVEGVLGVDLTGGLDREIQIYLDPAQLEYYGIGVGEVISRIQDEHRTTPAGNLKLGRSKFAVRIPGEYKDVKLMEEIVVKAPKGNPIRLRDIGRVVDGFKERATLSRLNGQECITLRVKKRAGENIVRIADDIRALLAQQKPLLPAGTSYTIRRDDSEFVRMTVSDLENNIISGLLLVLGVLFFALGLRNAFFVAIAIPLSFLISFTILQAMGITLNMVVLFSLILALGMLVDNSIVVVENIYRHASEGKSKIQAALDATAEVAWPIIASTATTLAVFAPILGWPGIMGDFMRYLPTTVIVVLSSSLFVALVINPVVAADFIKRGAALELDPTAQGAGRLLGFYQRLLAWSLGHPKLILASAVAIFAATLVAFSGLNAGVEFFPETTPERAQVVINAPQGTRLEQTDIATRMVERVAAAQDNTEDVIANVGFGGGMLFIPDANNSHQAVADVEFKDRHHRPRSTFESVRLMRQGLASVVGAEVRVELEEMGPPTGSPVSLEIIGKDFSELERLAQRAQRILKRIANVVDVKDDYEAGKPELRIEVNREQAMLRRLSTGMIAMAVRTAINGSEVAVLREGDEEYDIVVRYAEENRRSITDILDIVVLGRDDAQVPLRDVARVSTTAGLGSINHIDRRRTVLVSADVSGRSSAEVMADVKRRIGSELQLPDGYYVNYSGEEKEQQEAVAFLSKAFMIGIMAMLMILISQFNSVIRPAIILSSVVMSLAGVLWGLMLTHSKFGIIMTGLGVISLAGVVVNNAIVLIDYTNQLMEKHGLPLRQALERAGAVRFRPVLLTAITTILGLLPMALGFSVDFRSMTIDTSAPSMEMWGPMAQAVSFGLTIATILTLVLVPVMYQSQENFRLLLLRLWRRRFPPEEQDGG